MPWQEQKTGVSWMEILGFLTALDTLHGSTSWLDLSSGGTKHGTCWRVTVVSVFPVVSGRGAGKKLVSQVTWPNVNHAEIASAIYSLLYDHDARVSREVYKQGEF